MMHPSIHSPLVLSPLLCIRCKDETEESDKLIYSSLCDQKRCSGLRVPLIVSNDDPEVHMICAMCKTTSTSRPGEFVIRRP